MKMRLIVAALLLLSGCGEEPAAEVRSPSAGLVLATTLGSAPYAYRNEAGEIVGIDIEIAKAAAERLGQPLEIRPMEFSAILHAVKSGEADFAASAITITPGRARDVAFSHPYAFDGSAFLYRAGEPVPTIPLASRLRIGTQTVSISQFFLCRHGIDPVCEERYADLLPLFEAGRLDAIFYDAESIRETVAASNGKYAITPLVTRENYGIAVRRDRDDLLAAVNAVIAARRNAK